DSGFTLIIDPLTRTPNVAPRIPYTAPFRSRRRRLRPPQRRARRRRRRAPRAITPHRLARSRPPCGFRRDARHHPPARAGIRRPRSEEDTSGLQSRFDVVCRLVLGITLWANL